MYISRQKLSLRTWKDNFEIYIVSFLMIMNMFTSTLQLNEDAQ